MNFTWRGKIDAEDGVAVIKFGKHKCEIELPTFTKAMELDSFLSTVVREKQVETILRIERFVAKAIEAVKETT